MLALLMEKQVAVNLDNQLAELMVFVTVVRWDYETERAKGID